LGLQLTADTAVVGWAAAWTWVAVHVHGVVLGVASVSFRLRDGAGGISRNLDSAGKGVDRVPLVGDSLSTPLTSAGGAADTVAGAGGQLGEGISAAATPIAVAVVAATVLPLVVPWFVLRWRYARRAGASMDLSVTGAGARLLALRAIAGQPAHRLARVDPDPVAAWTRGDPTVIAELADLELRRLGLRGRAARALAVGRLPRSLRSAASTTR
jgi:hypothetical protein